MSESKSVLVGIVGSTRHNYILPEFFENITSQTHDNYDIIFIDTSSDNCMLQEYIKHRYPEIEYKHSHKKLGEPGFKKMCDCRQYFRERTLDGDYDYFYSSDCDTLVPEDTIERLISHNVDIVGALQPHGYFEVTFPCISKDGNFKLGYDEFKKQWSFYTWEEIEGKEGLMQGFSTGMGACLINSNVLEDVDFQYNGTFGEDIMFWLNVKSEGYNVYTDLDILAEHRNTGWDGIIYNSSLQELNEV